MNDVIDVAQRASYQLSSKASSKLRRMTRVSGLASENVISRVAIVRSLTEPLPDSLADSLPEPQGKEIKGVTLLGRPRPAALLLGMIAEHAQREVTVDDLKHLVRYHWERGISLLASDCPEGNVIDWLAEQARPRARGESGATRSRRSGAGGAPTHSRDEIAASIGRRYGRWPLEVRRLVAMAGRLELDRANEAADRLAKRADELEPGARVSESLALRVVAEWNLNRLGLAADDRRLLKKVAEAGVINAERLRPAEQACLSFLQKLTLVSVVEGKVQLTEAAEKYGQELWRK